MTNSSVIKEDQNIGKALKCLFSGFLISVVSSIVFLLILAAIMYFSSISDKIAGAAGCVLVLIAIFIGSMSSAAKASSHKGIFGGAVGFLCFLILYLFALELTDGAAFSLRTLITGVICVLVGMIGGAFTGGEKSKKPRKEKTFSAKKRKKKTR